ncbi:MAG TPA: class IV adenylate cyclase [Candidatus Lokiarchaeia archaeon]|nr:class IV adenylate cyclase [Candidatus Lokiarchaeia archaeon]
MSKKNLEIEIKVKISSIEEMAEQLDAAGAIFSGDLVHEDYYFDKPEKLGSFARTDEALRMRVSRNVSQETEQCYLTYKGGKVDSTTKTREEIEVGVDDGQKMREIIKHIGFREIIVVKKDRKNYTMDDISIMLDRVQYLDDPYMEVEIVADDPETLDVTREKLFGFLEQLGFSRDDSERRSYLELVLSSRGVSRKS